jgi:hypothetical protein
MKWQSYRGGPILVLLKGNEQQRDDILVVECKIMSEKRRKIGNSINPGFDHGILKSPYDSPHTPRSTTTW